MASIDNFKRGDTFQVTAALKDENDEPLVLDLSNIRSQVRSMDGNLVAELAISATETGGTYLLECDDTKEWPAPSVLEMDIEMTISGHVRSSDIITIAVHKDVTR